MSSAGASTSAAVTPPSGKRTLRLHVWGTNASLPTLDPTSLYAASLLQATFAHDAMVTLQFVSASTSLPCVPLLQVLDEERTTVQVVDEVEHIRSFCIAAGLDANLASHEELAAKQLALHALIDDQLLDLTLHSLFSFPANYRSVTAPAYSSVGGTQTPASKSTLAKIASLPLTFQPSIASRLRNVVQTRLTATGLWGLGGKEASAQSSEADRLAARAGIVSAKKKGLDQPAQQAVRDEFERSKLVTRAHECFAVINAALSTDNAKFALGALELGSLDAHLYGFLAPLLFAQPNLPVDTLSTLVRESYPSLARYLEHVKQQLDATALSISWISPADAQSSPPVLDGTTSTAMGSLSYLWPFATSSTKASSTTSIPPFHSSHQQPASSWSSSAPPHRAASAAKKSPTPDDRKLRWGRALWICSALVGLVGYTFASGIVSVQFVDPDHRGEDEDDEEDDEDDEDEDDEEEEDVDDGWEVQSESELVEELEEMEFDGDEDEEDEY